MGRMQPWVVVGYDGTAGGRTAVLVAAREAARRDRPLRIVAVVQPEDVGVLPRARYPKGAIGAAAELLAAAADLVRASLAPSAHDSEVLFGDPAEELVATSDGAELLIVGRGHVGSTLGSVALGVMADADCPVLVVGASAGEEPEGGTVVVGVDGRPESTESLEIAFAEAALSGATLVAVHPWHLFPAAGTGDPQVGADAHRAGESRLLQQALRSFRERYPSVPLSELAAEGPALRALLDAAADARMVIVGSRGRGPLKGLLLHSAGRSAVRHG